MRKNKKRPKDLVLTNTILNKKCPACNQIKKELIHFVHKDLIRDKRLLELFLCEDCCILYKQEIIKNNDKNYFYLIPILNTMLKAVGKFEEKTVEQIQEEMEVKIGEN